MVAILAAFVSHTSAILTRQVPALLAYVPVHSFPSLKLNQGTRSTVVYVNDDRVWLLAIHDSSFQRSHEATSSSAEYMTRAAKVATVSICEQRTLQTMDRIVVVVGLLLNVPATRKCISLTDLLRKLYVLPH